MIKIACCNHDLPTLNELRDLLRQYRTKRGSRIACAAFQSTLELLADLEKGTRYDVLFLDVLMPEGNGIDAAKEIRQYDSNVKIIFFTSSAEFAVQSYTVGAYFYLIKPLQAECFFELMDSVIDDCRQSQQSGLILRCKNGISRIDLDRLEYCEVIGRTLSFHMDNETVFESSGSLDRLRFRLEEYGNFMRPHRSFLVNMDYIRRISNKTITMDSGAEIPIPHGKCSTVKNFYLEYVFHREQIFVL